MDKKEQKSEFVQKLEATAQDFNKVLALEDQKGKGFILIGADLFHEDEDNQGTQIIIAGGGSRRLMIEALAELIVKPEMAHIVNEAMKLASVKKLTKIFNS